ncbi:MAG: class I SAM-dependent methyltransferase [Chloroflexi bacterium]|nr:class I SAM-dependent methyltransferase [Chloroflexota bacterium]
MINVKTLHNTSQLLLRNLNRLKGERFLVVNYPPDNFVLALHQQWPAARMTAFNYDYAPHLYLQSVFGHANLPIDNIRFGAVYNAPAERYDVAILFLPKSRALIQMSLQMVAAALRPGAQVWLVGENNAGIRSSSTLLEQQMGAVRTVDAARHCLLLQAMAPDQPVAFVLDEWSTTYPIQIGQQTLTVASLPGVFSNGQLDEGTQLLLETLDEPPTGRILDFGCGAGVIGASMKQKWPANIVEMVDANALALEATRRTMVANHLPIDLIKPSNVFSDVQGAYTQIISNPPFHTGVKTDYRVVTDFLQKAAQHLAPGGSLRIVANSFLKYQPLIEAHVGNCRVVAENRSYRIYEGIHK